MPAAPSWWHLAFCWPFIRRHFCSLLLQACSLAFNGSLVPWHPVVSQAILWQSVTLSQALFVQKGLGSSSHQDGLCRSTLPPHNPANQDRHLDTYKTLPAGGTGRARPRRARCRVRTAPGSHSADGRPQPPPPTLSPAAAGGHARTGAWPSSAAMSVMASRCSFSTSLTAMSVPFGGMSNTSTIPEDSPAGAARRRLRRGLQRCCAPPARPVSLSHLALPQALPPREARSHTALPCGSHQVSAAPSAVTTSPCFTPGSAAPPGAALPVPPPGASLTHTDETFSCCRDPSGKRGLC